ncbi:MAG: hypothetical protein P8Y63_13790 [Deltaproteobacteria bacterium]|jgi:membrane-bound metal-dependent hydrolase YbcI (DUF457 family)
MFAINHAATGLIIKRIFPDVSITAILVSVQLIEGLWVIFNFLGVEKTTTENRVESVNDVHLDYMPFSHSVVSTVVLAVGAWILFALGFKAPDVGAAVAVGICSHIVLDLISHARDVVIIPFWTDRKFGMGLYEKPPVAFVFETIYGIFCWWVYRGSTALFWVIVIFNLANSSFFIKKIPGPEKLMANKPSWITSVVAVQIIATAVLVGIFS